MTSEAATATATATDDSTNGEKTFEMKKILQHKQEKAIVHDLEIATKEFRSKMSDQLKCLGDRTDAQLSSLSELQDFFRKRGEIEGDYANKLEKLSKSIAQKHKSERLRRESWSQHASSTVWHQMVEQTKEESKKRQALSELYGKQITSSIDARCEDLAKISKRCREIGSFSHTELNRVLTELQTAMKTYQICYAELCGIERKKRSAEDDVRKYEEANQGKFEGTRRHRSLMKYFKRRDEKYETVRLKCTKSRNEYLLCIQAANAALHRFFSQDLCYLMDCMDLGMDFWIRSILEKVIDERKGITQFEMDCLAALGTLRSTVDAKADKQKFFEANHKLFMLPKLFEFRPQLGDALNEVSAEQTLSADLLQRQRQIEKRLEGLQFEIDEVWKSLEASEKQLLQLYNTQFEGDVGKWRNDLHVTYQYYLKKFELFLLNGNLMERLEARSATIGEALAKQGVFLKNMPASSSSAATTLKAKNGTGGGSFVAGVGSENGSATIGNSYPTHGVIEERRSKTKRIGGIATKISDLRPRPKLFGGSLDEYVEITGESIPLLVESAIGYLSRFSLRNQGLFRISGSQSEITRFKEAYEKGEDLFAYLEDGTESNSVAGVLKLYFRELREPIFPIFLFEQFCDCAKADNPQEFVRRVRDLISKLPLSHLLLLRFLFSFLSHLCEFADENMMEPHNLAICIGPTLIPIPEGKDQVFYHNYVNELVRNLIIHADEVFPKDIPGPVYDKYAIPKIEEDQGHYIEENDLVSEDDDLLVTSKLSHQPSTAMNDSTYESADRMMMMPSPISSNTTTNGTSGRTSGTSPADFGQISSNRSKTVSEMPHRIANELNDIFKKSSLTSEGVMDIASLRHSNVIPEVRQTSLILMPPRSLSTDYQDVPDERDYASPPPLTSTQYVEQQQNQRVQQHQNRQQKQIDEALYTPMIKQRATTMPAASLTGLSNGSLSDLSIVSAGAAMTTTGASSSSSTTTTGGAGGGGVRIIGKSSLRDQLQLIRKEQDGGGIKSSGSVCSNGSSKSGGVGSSERNGTLSSRQSSTDDETTVKEKTIIGKEPSQPDIIHSSQPRTISPTLDDIVAALNLASNFET